MPTAAATSHAPNFAEAHAAALALLPTEGPAGAHGRLRALARQVAAGILPASAAERRRLQDDLWRLAPFWWGELRRGGTVLRRCRADDAAFFRACHADAQFAATYNRQQAWSGSLERALARFGTEPPASLGMLQWVIARPDGERVGLASLSSIDAHNARAEFSVGFPGIPPAGMAYRACLLALHFAFFVAGLNKLYAYVYADNARAAANASRLGLRPEGVLVDHFRLPGVGFVSVQAWGLTRTQLLADTVLLRNASRLLGVQWAAAAPVPRVPPDCS